MLCGKLISFDLFDNAQLTFRRVVTTKPKLFKVVEALSRSV